ncbi:putative DNA/RNA-binding protein Alba [Rosa chinensis]|uniref:Putative DNA/RNA-binding protein Alba n=1 Tax=Rosa chinensis TaxID=74649 RepID=A0A2P6R5T0_ROSCH|nr:uncharacterized protein At2g34160 [Rosa chinensis]PRQ41783.1 putative DNA/RNA-binding protein Alba [Rosa chinensis]
MASVQVARVAAVPPPQAQAQAQPQAQVQTQTQSQTQAIGEQQKKNRIQVSNTKKPLFFYVNLAKRYIEQHNEVELSALGMAITTVVTIAEILKNNGLAIEKKVSTSTVGMRDDNKGRLVQKAKIEIVLGKSEKFDSIMSAAAAAQAAQEPAAEGKK